MRLSSGKTMALLAALVFTASLASLVGVSGTASAYSPVEVSMDVPTFAGALEKVACTLVVTGGPSSAGEGNFTYKAEIIADNSTGSMISPSSGTSARGVFNLTITMPGEAQTITVRVNATSTGEEDVSEVRDFKVRVVEPIVITATVYNTGSVAAENVTATFYADGILLGEQEFSLAAGASIALIHNWTWANIADGEHVVTVAIDDEAGIVEFSDGNNVYSETIYVGTQGNPIGGVLTVAVIIMSVLVALMFMAKPAKRKK